jgi:hypothetical protein
MASEVKEQYEGYSVEATQRRRESARIKVAQWRIKNPEKYRAQISRYREANKEKIYAKHRVWAKQNRAALRLSSYKSNLKLVFGITLEEYEAIWEKQGKVCAICKKSPEEVGERFHLDHDHSKQRHVRGILCPRCNHGLGHFKDDTNLLEEACKYLKRGDLLLTI